MCLKILHTYYVCTVGERFVIVLRTKCYSTLYFNYVYAMPTTTYYAKLQMALHKTTNRTTQNYKFYYTNYQSYYGTDLMQRRTHK